jgi:glutathione S-transferase
VVSASLPRIRLVLAEIERLAAGGPHLVGGAPSLADFYLAPIFAYLGATPEAKDLLGQTPKLQGWWSAMADSPAMAATAPQFG